MMNAIDRARAGAIWAVLASLLLWTGCGTAHKQKEAEPFFTSGSREADQRAEQRVAKDQQLKGKGEDTKEKGDASAGVQRASAAKSLFERLGSEPGVNSIIDDFVPRALADPRVNWQRKGITRGGFLGFRKHSVEWNATPETVNSLKKHLAQFIAVATGGPSKYEGRAIKQVHHGMKISNTEFDAGVGDLKATLDKLGVATGEQKELLAIIESTRLEIVEQR